MRYQLYLSLSLVRLVKPLLPSAKTHFWNMLYSFFQFIDFFLIHNLLIDTSTLEIFLSFNLTSSSQLCQNCAHLKVVVLYTLQYFFLNHQSITVNYFCIVHFSMQSCFIFMFNKFFFCNFSKDEKFILKNFNVHSTSGLINMFFSYQLIIIF